MKKAQINQVFVYILSIIVILFVSFLVIKFILNFWDTTENYADIKFLDTLESDYKDIYQTYGAEKVLAYKVSKNVDKVCFLTELSCVDSLDITDNKKVTLNSTYESGSNVVLFDNDDIILARDLGEYTALNGCFCVKPTNTRFELKIENNRNKVLIEEN